MKLHLPLTLLTAVLSAVIALPAQAVDAPEGYTTTYLNSPGTLENYSSLTAEDYMAFILQSSQEITPTGADYWTSSTPLISGGNVFFGSGNSDSPVALSFKDGKGSAFYGQSALTFDTLSSLIFSSITGNSAAIYLADGGSLTISNVNDGLSGTADVLFTDIKNTSVAPNSHLLSYPCYDGAIYANGNLTISYNGDITFRGNSAASSDSDFESALSYGGAIHASGEVTISYNGDVTFCSNTAESFSSCNASIDAGNMALNQRSFGPMFASYGGAIEADDDLTISNNSDIYFTGNSATACFPSDTLDYSSHTISRGGAICANGGLTISNNGDVSFSENSVYASSSILYNDISSSGGAIYANGGLTISNNGDVSFSGNSSSATGSSSSASVSSDGGAIYASGGAVTISHNGDVFFSDNSATSYTNTSSGGAIYAYYGGVTISQNGEVSFSGNNANDHGGAIYASDGVTISQNGDVSFSDNSGDGDGGAIFTDYSDVTISQNGNVYFSDNVASTHGGGAINAYYGGVTISQNGEVSFSGNNANDHGGAIWATHDITVSQNGDVSFSGNSSSHRLSSSYGGAICSESGDVTISHNDDVSFSGNSTAPTATSSYGGAIYAFRVVTLSDNGDVSFSGNSSTRGGAIYARGSLSIQGNDSVLFEKNYKKDGEYCLLSIYSTSDMTLSAKTGGNITFYDSVYSSGTTYFNSDYTDAEGDTQSAKGDIIFSGKYAEQHLNEILVANNENRTATDEEILNSLTSKIQGKTYLYDGRLRIEDGAIYKGQGLTVLSSTSGQSNPTVLLKNGEMNHDGCSITLNAGARLELSGTNTISADNMQLNNGAGFVFNVDDTHLTTAALSYTGALTLGGELVICINSKEGLINGNTYKLMTVTGTSTTEAISWGSTNITIQAGDGLEVVSDDLIWQDNVLYLNYSGTTTYGYTWLGGKKAVWQTDNETLWMNALGDKVVYRDGAQVTFTQDTIEIVGEVQPSSITLAPVKSLTFKTKYNKKAGEWSGSIGGEGISVTIAGGAKGKVTMNDGNTYTGITSIESGTVNVGGSMSFGKSSIVISGGTLDLKSKAVANEIELTGSATIKGGKKYLGTYSQTGGELMKGSVLNVAESATLTGGVVNGTLSGEGSVTVDGDVELGTTGKITTDKLLVDGTLSVSNKGLAMNTKTSSITVEAGGQLISEGALKSAALTVDGGLLELHSAKASSIAITNNMRLRNGADVTAFANVKAANLLMTGAQLTLGQTESDIRGGAPSIALSLNAKGNVVLTSSALTLSGKISTGNLTVTDSYVNMTSGKLQTIAVKNTLTLSGDNSFIFDFDAKDGKSYKLFTFKYFISDGTALHELLGWEANESYTLTANAKNITLKVNDAEAWEAYMDTLANGEAVATLSEDDELVESAGAFVLARPVAAVDPMLGKVADTLVQSTWGTAGASRSFGDTIAARSTHATALAEGKAAAWISTMGGSSRISSDGGHAGADSTLTGAAFGMEARLSEKFTVGMAIGNSWGKVSTFSAFPVDQDSTHQGIYGKHLLGSSTTLSWMAAHTRTESDGKLAGMACDWTQDALQLDARVDKLFAISDRTTVSAFVGMQYLATDKGECNGLSTGSLQNLRGEIGVSAAHKATDKAYVYGELSFIGDMVRHNPTATVGDHRSRGANPGRAGLNLSVGASYQLNDNWSLNGSYNLELMQNQTSHSANVGATYSF